MALVASQAAPAADWDRMAEFAATVGIDTRSERIRIELPLLDRLGKPRYLLWCEGGSDRYLDQLSAATNINYVGPLMCVLNEGSKRTEASLLAEDDVGPWHTRGMFRWQQLLGDCARYPEYGRTRHFKLRGFDLTLEAADTVVVDGDLSAFNLRISVKDDPTAVSRVAARPGFLPPQGNCSVVRTSNEPRMCRDWPHGGAYVTCAERGKSSDPGTLRETAPQMKKPLE
jgi:hypothetical protein